MLRLATVVSALALAFISAPLVASAQAPSLNWGSQVNPSRCPTDQGYRYLEINVTRKVENDLALRHALNAAYGVWAHRDFNQHIQVWQVGIVEPPPTGGGERFCALVRYQGSFSTIDNAMAPGSDNILDGDIDGSFEGGYRLVFNADELGMPTEKTRGHIGTFGGPVGLYDWVYFYFTNFDVNKLTPEWWGWVYHGGNNGARVDSIDGDQGDIIN